MKKVLLDCDPGIDDALAVLLGLGSPGKIDIKAIVSTFGNVGLVRTRNNLLTVLSFFKNIPIVGSGSSGPLNGTSPSAREVHGQDGLGNVTPLFRKRRAQKILFKNGISLIIDSALSKRIDTIIATGPLTDLARAIKRNPAFLDSLDEIIIMGGAVFVKGNVTPYAEFNFYCDPEAAKIVLNSGVKKTLISLDVTQKTLLVKKHLKPLKDINTDLAGLILNLAQYSILSNKKRGFPGAPMHDPLAVALVVDRSLGGYEELCLDVKTEGRQRGRVVLKNGKPNVRFCKKINTAGFFDLFINTLLELTKQRKRGAG